MRPEQHECITSALESACLTFDVKYLAAEHDGYSCYCFLVLQLNRTPFVFVHCWLLYYRSKHDSTAQNKCTFLAQMPFVCKWTNSTMMVKRWRNVGGFAWTFPCWLQLSCMSTSPSGTFCCWVVIPCLSTSPYWLAFTSRLWHRISENTPICLA